MTAVSTNEEATDQTVVFPADAEFEIPVDEIGEPLPYCWVNLDQAIFATSLTGILGELLPGYAEAVAANDDILLFELRLESLAAFAQIEQERLMAAASAALEREEPDSDGFPEELLTVTLSPKDGAIVELDEWEFELPLYLLSTQYAPYTEVEAPRGEFVSILDPVSERGFLDALAALGLGQLFAS